MDPKRTFRFILSSDKIDPFIVKSIKRPNFGKGVFSFLELKAFEFVLYDTAVFDITKKIYSFIEDPDDLCLKFIKEDGQVYETWLFKSLSISSVEFSESSYKDDESKKSVSEIRFLVEAKTLEVYGLNQDSSELLFTLNN